MLSLRHMDTGKRAIIARRQRGVSLIELMIAMTITLFIMGVMTAVFVSNSRSRAEVERASQELENSRYALQQLGDDLQMAGYWAEFNIGNAIATTMATPTALPDPCTDASSVASLTALANAMPIAVQGYYQGNSSSNGGNLSCISDWKSGTDVLVVRRVSGCQAGVDANCSVVTGAPYFQASACNGPNELNALVISSTISGGSVPGQFLIDTNTANLTLHKRDCSTVAAVHQFLVHIYYKANNDQAGDGIPTLKRAELGPGTGTAAWTTVTSVAQGVENMHIEYGVNTNGDHMDTTGTRTPNVYLADPDHTNTTGAAGCTVSATTDCPSNFANTVAVQLYLLVRNPSPTISYTDTKSYTLGTATPVAVAAKNDDYKRHVYTQEVMLWNPSIR